MTVVFDGVAYGLLLFLISVGLSVTLGLMNFVNLAHGAFAMLGGYVCVLLLDRFGVPFLAALPLVALASALVGVLLERTLYRRLYGASHLDQVLFSIGLVFVAMSTAHFFFGAQQQPLQLPEMLSGQFHLPGGLDVGVYRLFLIVIGLVLAFALQWMIAGTQFGAKLRASVDNPRAARGLGIDVDRVFVLTFALGSGLAGLGGALGVDMLGLDPGFALKYIVYFLIVVAVGGSNIKGSLVASLILGVCDVAGKYYIPQVGAFVIYAVMVAMLIFRPQGLFGRTAAK
jgi:branched-chain amino acid transport system permease protein